MGGCHGLAREEEALHGGGAALMQFWQARLQALALWLADYEADRAKHIAASHVEVSGHLQLGDITVTAKADRIDRLKNGAYEIIDYKSGQPPSQKAVTGHLAPQLTLEADSFWDGVDSEQSSPTAARKVIQLMKCCSLRSPRWFHVRQVG